MMVSGKDFWALLSSQVFSPENVEVKLMSEGEHLPVFRAALPAGNGGLSGTESGKAMPKTPSVGRGMKALGSAPKGTEICL